MPVAMARHGAKRLRSRYPQERNRSRKRTYLVAGQSVHGRTFLAWPRRDLLQCCAGNARPFAIVSQRAHLCTAGHDIDQASFPLTAAPIHIAAYGWVAAEAFVGPGVHIGEGAVLGARSVSFRDLDAWAVYTGNPAKPVRQRRKTQIIQSTGFKE